MTKSEVKQILSEKRELIYGFMKEAAILHDAKVNQRYDEHPYSYHLKMVYNNAAEYAHLVCENEQDVLTILFAAMFHDSIEDARFTYHDVMDTAKKYMELGYAVHAADLVYALTNEKGRNRAERENDKYFEDMKKVKNAPFLKFCDRIANFTYARQTQSSMYKKYKKELPEFIERLGHCVPPEMVEEIKEIAGE